MGTSRVTERLVSQLWNDQAIRHSGLVTTDGLALQVVYRGRWSHNDGPDFRRAILSLQDGRLLSGDVEVHLRSSDWYAHGHHLDRNYDSVILHVVAHNDSANPTLKRNGEEALVLSLEGLLPSLVALSTYEPEAELGSIAGQSCRCANGRARPDEPILALLESLGNRWFAGRVAQFEGELSCSDPEQVLYAGLLEALGYKANQAPFRRLAATLPLQELRVLVESRPASERLPAAQAALLGAAGLLSCQGPGKRALDWQSGQVADQLEALWLLMSSSLHSPSLQRSDWTFSRLRPSNHPVRRVAAAAHLCTGPLARRGFLGLLFGDERDVGKLRCGLLQAVTVGPTSDIWSTHADFGLSFSSRSHSLIGPGRAAELVVNVLLPFMTAHAELSGDQSLFDLAWEAYRTYGSVPGNELARATARQLAMERAAPSINSARRRQGLLYLYKRYCLDMHCPDCPAGMGRLG